MTSVAPSGTITLVVSSAVCWLGMLLVTEPELRSGWISIRTIPSSETNGRSRSRVPVFRNWTCWIVLVKFWDSVWNPSREPSWISARCLFKTRIRGLARILVLPIVSRAWTNPVTLLATKPNLTPLVAEVKPWASVTRTLGDGAGRGQQLRRGKADVAVQRRSGADRAEHRAQVVDHAEVNTELRVVLVVHADDDRLDQDLDRPDVDSLDDLVDDLEVGFIVLDDQVIEVRKGVAAGWWLDSRRSSGRSPRRPSLPDRPSSCTAASAAPTAAGRHRLSAATDERRRLTDSEPIRRRDRDPRLTDVCAQERPDDPQDLVRADIIQFIDSWLNPFFLDHFFVVLELVLGVDVVDRAFVLVHEVGQLDDRVEDLFDRDAFEIGGDRAGDLGRDEDVHPAPPAEQFQELAHVQLVGVHRDRAAGVELDLLLDIRRGRLAAWPADPSRPGAVPAPASEVLRTAGRRGPVWWLGRLAGSGQCLDLRNRGRSDCPAARAAAGAGVWAR